MSATPEPEDEPPDAPRWHNTNAGVAFLPEYPGARPMPPLPDVPPCVTHPNRDLWVSEDWLESRQAALICLEQCPLRTFEACQRVAQDTRPTVGVWAAQRWVGVKWESLTGRPARPRRSVNWPTPVHSAAKEGGNG